MFLTIFFSLLIIGSSGKSSVPCQELKIKDHFVSWGHEKVSQPREIKAIIIHSSYNALGPDSFGINGILDEYKQINVSPHYIIDRDGKIFRLVDDQDVAYHAGKSRLPDGTINVNNSSIGIEVINTEHDSPTEEQYTSLLNLIECLKNKYPIKYILGHNDIAPGRKSDPWNFDWKKFNVMLEDQ